MAAQPLSVVPVGRARMLPRDSAWVQVSRVAWWLLAAYIDRNQLRHSDRCSGGTHRSVSGWECKLYSGIRSDWHRMDFEELLLRNAPADGTARTLPYRARASHIYFYRYRGQMTAEDGDGLHIGV